MIIDIKTNQFGYVYEPFDTYYTIGSTTFVIPKGKRLRRFDLARQYTTAPPRFVLQHICNSWGTKYMNNMKSRMVKFNCETTPDYSDSEEEYLRTLFPTLISQKSSDSCVECKKFVMCEDKFDRNYDFVIGDIFLPANFQKPNTVNE